jgi:exodeoxyribonuclease V alpha subunit
MLDTNLPPLSGILAHRPETRPARWQRALGDLHLPEGALALADELARIPGDLEPDARLDLALLVLMLLGEEARGSTCLPLDDEARAGAFLAALEGASAPPWARLRRLAEGCGPKQIFGGEDGGTPLVAVDGRLASRRYVRSEAALAAAVRARIAPPAAAPDLDPRLLRCPEPLTGEQAAAVALALTSRLALVTGGPGTGKTTIVVAVLRALLHAGAALDDLLLAAPTGKAAQRLGQAVRDGLARIPDRDGLDQALLDRFAEPRTLHRLLGWHAGLGAFRHRAGNPLAGKVVIVDEASMVGQELMAALFDALPPEATLVLLGDPDQLPSVDAGQVFRDLVAALPAACQRRLTFSHRMEGEGRQLLQVARAVNAGDLQALWRGPDAPMVRTSLAELEGRGVEFLTPDRRGFRAFLHGWMQERVWTLADGRDLDALLFPPLDAPAPGEAWTGAALDRIRAVTAQYNRSRILCPVNAGPDGMGVDGINEELHRLALEKAGDRLAYAPEIIVGEPVMVLRNDYRRDLFNGDQGVVMMVRREEARPEAFFPRGEGFVSFPLAALRETLALGYAMTVHKAQGSEFDRVALVVPDLPGDFLTRGILYTGLTRARTAATILAGASTWNAGVARQERRFSHLGARLAAPPEP